MKHPTLASGQNFLGLEAEYSTLDQADIAIVPAPYEHTVSYGSGTANGPESILELEVSVVPLTKQPKIRKF